MGAFAKRIPYALRTAAANGPAIAQARALLAARKLKRLSQRISGIEPNLSLALNFNYLGLGIRPWQVPDELLGLLVILEKSHPNTVLELGTGQGGTLFLFTRLTDSEGLIISVDRPNGSFGGGYAPWLSILFNSFATKGQRIHLVRRDSHNPSTKHRVERLLNSQGVDFLFIDADHTHRGVKSDFQMYSPLVRKGGIIALHDIVDHPPSTGVDVARFWREIRDSYASEEIVQNWDQGWAGIGVIHV